ncbi:MarR family transcriptional regulator [Microbacterium sp. zg-YB36]|uniref:MarR family winged helix-turn-helix transcriptional regulator n=1 Tax=Microbacterium sp. zg-YB36 TaxID=2969407 RepID=UPI00214ABA40|nr:MarR family transcriptional regulator [Microbacterium sp. zg-YB36]MDL5351554.1 MarR family transcriptional regulator [Microbacterium sp. zg-YB36]
MLSILEKRGAASAVSPTQEDSPPQENSGGNVLYPGVFLFWGDGCRGVRGRSVASTAGEINALANLAARDEQTVSELSRCIGTPPSTMTSLLDRLAKRGLITRRTPETNRRTVVVGLTEAGRELAGESRKAISEIDADLGARLTAEDVAQLRRMLRVLSAESP